MKGEIKVVSVSIFNKNKQVQDKIKLPATSLKFLVAGLAEYQNKILGVENNEITKIGTK
ncbi:hypothetical protein [Megamonas funiformis]|uniref:hypothetical protein n=1 Tax=Megamonas funiformis TaxID=437897 RepID=UPI00267593EC|nr:hypothetical protein [Megamonas funiformis]